MLLFIESIVTVVDGIVIVIIKITNYILQVWKNNMFRKWVLICIDIFHSMVYRLRNYLEKVKVVILYRIHYEKITRPMKEYYKEIRRK